MYICDERRKKNKEREKAEQNQSEQRLELGDPCSVQLLASHRAPLSSLFRAFQDRLVALHLSLAFCTLSFCGRRTPDPRALYLCAFELRATSPSRPLLFPFGSSPAPHRTASIKLKRLASFSFSPMSATTPLSPRCKTIRFDGEAYEVAVYDEDGTVRSIEVRLGSRRTEGCRRWPNEGRADVISPGLSFSRRALSRSCSRSCNRTTASNSAARVAALVSLVPRGET
jgi:hypothetical protein